MVSTESITTTVVYVSNADSQDISVMKLDPLHRTMTPIQTLAVAGQVMPLAVSPDRQFLYAAIRSKPYSLASFRIEQGSGRLIPIGSSPLSDSIACISTDRLGRTLFAASYDGHAVSFCPIEPGGLALAPTQRLLTGRNTHCARVDLGNRHLFVSSLGGDAVNHLRFDPETGQATMAATPGFQARPKSGPRHLVFHPDGRALYVLNELDATVDLLAIDSASGQLSRRQTVSTQPAGASAQRWAADIHITPDGRWLFTSERNSSTLSTCAVDVSTGLLTLQACTATETQPRGFGIDASGRFMIVVGQRSDSATLYAIDPVDGGLMPCMRCAVGRNPNWVEIVALR